MAQDNAAQAIKDLKKNLEDADMRIKALTTDIPAYFQKLTAAFSAAAKNANVSIDQIFDYIAQKRGAVAAQKIKLQFDTARAKSDIDEILQALGSKNKSVTLFGGETLTGTKAMKDRLLELKKEYEALAAQSKKTVAQMTDDLLNIVNATVGRKNQSSGTALGKARAKEMEGTQKAMTEINRLIEERNKLEANLKKQGHADKYYDRQRKGIEEVNRKIEEQKRLLSSYGGRGRQALSALGGDGSATALRQQEQNFRKLNMLLNERRKLEAQIKAQGGTANETQSRYQRILNAEIKNTVNSMRELGKRYEGITRQAARNTMEERARRTKKTIDSLNGSLKQTRSNLSSMIHLLQRLGSAFGIVFSVRGLAQFGKKLVETRGEFEMQFVAMKQIIGDVDAATKIWGQTMQQALKSPFKAMQLVTYTKQLAAYRIETEKLFDTTKRLADVSAGLGVDMGRLILAYGQVKAANYLRASEVRQFTEAGVNIAGNLAKYFSELEGRAVGTAEVMERITKRMVLFSDVEAIFKRMTDEGGEFFNMQEIQADTVKGQIMKLQDAYQQMLNTIGESKQGTIRDLIDSLNGLVRHWRDIESFIMKNVYAMGALLPLILTYRRGARLAAGETFTWSRAMKQIELEIAFATTGIKKFSLSTALGTSAVYLFKGAIEITKTALKTFLPLLIIEGLMALVTKLQSANRELSNMKKELSDIASESTSKMGEEIREYDKLIEKLKQTTEGTMARKEVLDEISQKYGKYLDFIVTEKTTIDELAGAYDNVVTSIRNYTAEKIREEQQQRLEKGMYDEYQNLEEIIKGYQVVISQGTMIKPSSQQAKNIAQIIQKKLEEDPNFKAGDIYGILNSYFGSEGVIENNLLDKQLSKVIRKYRKLGQELKDIRDEIERNTPVFETEEEYINYTNNVAKAEEEIRKQNKASEDQIQKIKDTETRAATDQWKIDDKIQKLRIENEKQILKIRLQYGLITQDQYKKELDRINGVLDTYETDYNKRLEAALAQKFGPDFLTAKKEARDMYNWVVSAETALQQGTTQRNKQLIDTYKGLKDSLKQYKDSLTAALNSGASQAAINLIQENINVTTAHMAAIELAAALRGIDLSDKKTGGAKESASKLISLIKEMRGEYDKLSKSAYGYAKSEEKVREAYKDSVKEILGKAGITDYDFTTNEGMIKALEKVKSYATRLGKDAAAEVQKYIDQLETEIEINAQVRIREDFGKQMEKAFNDYELTIELKKLNISPEAAKGLFPEFDAQTLGDLQNEMQAFYMQQGATFDEEDLKEYQKWAEKIDSEILKDRKEKAKDYSKYLEKEYSERAKLEMKYAQDVAFVTANFNGEQRQNILSGIEDKYQKDISELTWKSFKESAFYVEMMDDLSSIPVDYMQIMLGKIEELLQNPETLSPRALKEAINARQKILESLMDYDQVKVMSQSLSEIHTAMNDSEVGGSTWRQTKKRLDEQQKLKAEELANLEKEIRANETLQGQLKGLENAQQAFNDASANLSKQTQEDLKGKDSASLMAEYNVELENARKSVKAFSEIEGEATSEQRDANAKLVARIEYLEIAIPLLEAYKKASEGLWSYENTDEGKAATSAQDKGQTSSSIGTIITGQKNKADNLSNRLSLLKKWQKSFVNLNNAWAKFNKNAADMASRLGALASASFELYEALGGETNAMTEAWKEFGSTITNVITESLTMIPQLVAGFTAAGVTINAAMGIIGLIAEAIQLVLVLITGLAKLHDARYEKEIEIQQKKIDELQRAYERLEKQIEKTWDTISYMKVYNDETQNLYEQIQALNAQMNAEESKKNVDKDKIQDYKDKIQDAEDELEELAQKQIEVFGGIGKEGYRDAAQGFVDAWKSAFLETGDGLQGLQDHFDEFLNEWFVKQATMRVAGKMLEPLFRDIDNAVDKYSGGGTSVMMSELAKIRERFGIIAPQLSDTLDELSGLWGIGGEGGLSGLAAGIQGMTEEQANVLEAYWNSVRGYTANIDMNVSRIAQILGAGGDNANPMLHEMELIAQNTSNIRELLNTVSYSGGEGVGIRVYSY